MPSTGVTGLILYSVLGDQEHKEPRDPVTWLQPHCNCLGQLLVMFQLDHISEPHVFLLVICVYRMCFCLAKLHVPVIVSLVKFFGFCISN